MITLTHERLLERLHYDPATGIFTSRVATGYLGWNKAGKVCGSPNKGNGYVYIVLDGKGYLAHRLAWFYVHGTWPVGHGRG